MNLSLNIAFDDSPLSKFEKLFGIGYLNIWSTEDKKINKIKANKSFQNISFLFEKLYKDYYIWIELFTPSKSEDKEGKIGYVRNGSCGISVMDLINKTYNKEIPLIFNNYRTEDGKFIIKGLIIINEVKIENEIIPIEISIKDSFIPENFEYINKINNLRVMKNIGLLVEKGREYFSNILQPKDEIVGKMHAPFYLNTAGSIPIEFFFIISDPFQTINMIKEDYFLYLTELVINRYKKTIKWFNNEILKQFNIKNDLLNEEFIESLSIISSICCAPSTSLPYISDFFYLENNQIPIEYFANAFNAKSGDCEDLAFGIHLISTTLEYSNWTSEILNNIQKILNLLYVSHGCLGSVTSKYLTNENSNDIIIIDSKVDKEAEVGGHLWYMWTPMEYFLKLLNNTSDFILPNEFKRDFYPWEKKLPSLIGEGTNMLYPLQQPIQNYYKNGNDILNMQEKIIDFIKKTEYIKNVVRFEKFQKMKENVKNARLSKFYRCIVHLYTLKFFQKNYGNIGFVPVNILNDEIGLDKYIYGVDIENFIFKENENIGIIPDMPLEEHEYNVGNLIKKQLQPNEFPYLENKNILSEISWSLDLINKKLLPISDNEYKKSIPIYFFDTAFNTEQKIYNITNELKKYNVKGKCFIEKIYEGVFLFRINVFIY